MGPQIKIESGGDHNWFAVDPNDTHAKALAVMGGKIAPNRNFIDGS